MVNVYVDRYVVNHVPEELDPDAIAYRIIVVRTVGDHWAVVRNIYNLNDQGEWDFAGAEDHSVPKWLLRHRFTMERALELAKEAAPHVTVGGITAEQARRRILTRSREAALAAANKCRCGRDRHPDGGPSCCVKCAVPMWGGAPHSRECDVRHPQNDQNNQHNQARGTE